ncbi:ATP-binding protein [Gemmiger sp.]
MIKSFYEEPIFSSDFDREELRLIDTSVQKLLDKNSGVGVVGGYYRPGLPVQMISELALHSLGYHGDEVFGNGHAMHFAERFPKDSELRDLETFRRFKGKRTLCLRTLRGAQRWFHICKDEKELPDGRVLWLMTLCDCNELHKREQWLIEARNTAEAANEAKSNFLSRMSHDIRTPLNGILGMAQIAQENVDDPAKVREMLDKLTAAGVQLETLINDVLDMSRLESGRVEILHQPFNLYELLARSGDLLRTQSDRMKLTRNVHFNNVHNYVIGGPLHVQRIVANLSSNAVKYNRVGGTINYTLDEIPVDSSHAVFRFTVQDTGIGMSEEFQKHLYEPFAQESDAVRSEFKGTGLGMSIAKELVERMGGTITLHSKLGEGSTFIVELPMELDLTAHEAPEADKPLPGLQGMYLLLAEDNELNAEVARYLLEKAGATVMTAADGKQAVALFEASGQGEAQQFDAILMDVVMPGMDGLAATRAIRASSHPQAKTIPIIAQTANAFAEDVRRTREAGMNDHVSKPLNEAQLIRVLAKYKK